MSKAKTPAKRKASVAASPTLRVTKKIRAKALVSSSDEGDFDPPLEYVDGADGPDEDEEAAMHEMEGFGDDYEEPIRAPVVEDEWQVWPGETPEGGGGTDVSSDGFEVIE